MPSLPDSNLELNSTHLESQNSLKQVCLPQIWCEFPLFDGQSEGPGTLKQRRLGPADFISFRFQGNSTLCRPKADGCPAHCEKEQNSCFTPPACEGKDPRVETKKTPFKSPPPRFFVLGQMRGLHVQCRLPEMGSAQFCRGNQWGEPIVATCLHDKAIQDDTFVQPMAGQVSLVRRSSYGPWRWQTTCVRGWELVRNVVGIMFIDMMGPVLVDRPDRGLRSWLVRLGVVCLQTPAQSVSMFCTGGSPHGLFA